MCYSFKLNDFGLQAQQQKEITDSNNTNCINKVTVKDNIFYSELFVYPYPNSFAYSAINYLLLCINLQKVYLKRNNLGGGGEWCRNHTFL